MIYSPREIYQFMTSKDFKSIMNQTFHKRHMESDAIPSPFTDPAKILFLEYLIDQNYIIAEYRSDIGVDNETYRISTLGNAFITMYRTSGWFRIKSMIEYYKILWWIAVASMIGSLVANLITLYAIQGNS